KRLELARALATDPQILLLDETAGGLTEHEVHELLEIIRTIKGRGVTILWIEHILHALTAIVDRMILMNFGSKLLEGDPSTVLASDELKMIYLGVD
ncbi:MAG: ABC transporter ATP-binding protein, partial [Roseiflexus sp.]|nr:ABC transporter ATP-binding protein [Roseiflexus sp.]